MEVAKCDRPEYTNNAFGDVFFKTRGKTLTDLDSSYVRSITHSSAVDTFYSLHILLKTKGKGREEVAETTLFSENSRIVQNPEEFYGQTGVYKDRGGCSYFSENPIFAPFPGFEDLDQADLAVIAEFCDPQVTDRSRRAVLRRLVDLILAKLGIDSTNVHEYTSRTRS